MKSYIVGVREVWNQLTRVKASNPEDAKARVAAGEGTRLDSPGGLEYSHTLDPETWDVEEDAKEQAEAETWDEGSGWSWDETHTNAEVREDMSYELTTPEEEE